MSELFEPTQVVRPVHRPDLPVPSLLRWQPLRIGLVEMFHYDTEEFWFRDGHLLLRGNNGTGKSKVLALTLPFLFDARLLPSRIEPDGDPGKRMAWNLLLNTYDRRTGYAWIEFGRVAEDGTPRYLTLGAGLAAVAARPGIESWFFILEDAADAQRIGQDLWLTSPQRIVLTKERLREAIGSQGQIYETAESYRRAVDERLFRLGATRYAALMDTLVQLRQPQLSKKPDEASLSNALTEALPPLATDLLGDVADALNRLEEDRRQLEEYQSLEKAVGAFHRRYQIYAATQSRRQARGLRQAQTEFDNASRAVNEVQARLLSARQAEAAADAEQALQARDLATARARLETLRSDPANQDANRLDQAARDAAARRRDVDAATAAADTANVRLRRATEETAHYAARAANAEAAVARRRKTAADLAIVVGIAAEQAANPLAALDRAELLALTPGMLEKAQAQMRMLSAARREHIALLRHRRTELTQAETKYQSSRDALDARQEDADQATQRRAQADTDVQRQGSLHQEAWATHLARLRQLEASSEAVQAALADWVIDAIGDNPAGLALQVALRQASLRFAARQVELDHLWQAVEDETGSLEQERRNLEAGEDAAPPVPLTRDPTARLERPGAPLWQLLEFHDHVDAAAQAGLEAALQAAGLLDAWVAPDGALQTADGRTLHDTQALVRDPRSVSLAAWIGSANDARVPAGTIARILAAVACGDDDPGDAEAWIAPDGRFRLGALAGAWSKPAAVHIGFAARAAARTVRLAQIAERLQALAAEGLILRRQTDAHAQAEADAAKDWQDAPPDQALRQAHLIAATCAREFNLAQERLAPAQAACEDAEHAARIVRQALIDTATDLRLPEAAEALLGIETELGRFDEARQYLAQAVADLRAAVPELRRQQIREDETRSDRQQRQAEWSASLTEAAEAEARWEALRDAVGAQVEALQKRLADAVKVVNRDEQAVEAATLALRQTGEARAVAEIQAAAADITLRDRIETRALAVATLQRFAATGLISAALGQIDLPALWTIAPALTLAQAIEQALSSVADSDEVWARIQRQVSEELTELQRALTALGHQAQAEASDYGLIVTIVYQNRPERPDQLADRLVKEITFRLELLTANERAVLENHLQAEIATELQRLLQAAERQVDAINTELHKRPTSTGVRYRLQWQPIQEGGEGAPVGLEAARRRLLNTSTDLWSAEDRRVVGTMLQQRIAAERESGDAAGGSLLDHLARALDYRRWHEFRVQRWQDGQWRKLSGPASSGERALGLTVPLFAAVASFYSQSGYAHAPRLVLLDEAFAGIDSAARAHCMGLIREFDLDFVITSESEWGCYAELPGVSICQLQRREGIDAVFVSRWTWDGRARLRNDDPDRRYPPA